MSILCSSGGFSERQLQSVAVLLDVVYPLLPWSSLRSTSGDVSVKEGVWVSLRLHTRNEIYAHRNSGILQLSLTDSKLAFFDCTQNYQ